MSSKSLPNNTNKFYFYYSHHHKKTHPPTNRIALNPNHLSNPLPKTNFLFKNWDPQNPNPTSSPPQSHSEKLFSLSQTLSPIARYIFDSFRKNNTTTWDKNIVTDLNKLRMVTPKVVSEVLKVETDPRRASRFFHWAGKQKGFRHNFISYNALTYCLNRNNRYRAADQVPELMNSQGKVPSEKQFEILIRMHVDAGRGRRLYYVYEKMRKFGVKPRVFLYNRVMDGLVKTGLFDLALSVYRDFKEDGLVEEGVTFMILVKGLCKAGRVEEALDFLGRMRRNLCKPDVFAYTAMIRVLVMEGNVDGSLKVWKEMRGDGVYPDVMAYTTLITGLCMRNEVEKGYELFKEMKGEGHLIDRDVYGILIEAFVAKGKLASAIDLSKDLVSSGYRADLSIYNSLIRGLCSEDRVDKAYKLFLVTVQEGLGPDFVTINSILVSYAENSRLDEFYRLLKQMQKLRLNVVDNLSKFFSSIVGKSNSEEIALEVFEYLKGKEYCSVSIYNTIIEALYNVGEAERALAIFEEMEGTDFKPDSSTYSNVISCLIDVGNVEEASVCYKKMREMLWVPTISAYSSLIKGFYEIREFDTVHTLVCECLGNATDCPLEFKYSLAIRHECRSNDAEKVIEVLNEMMEQGCAPNEIIYSAIISGMCEHGSIEEARKVFENLREKNLLREANLIVYDELLIDHASKRMEALEQSGIQLFDHDSE